ncbi:MAG: hypothetical protein IJY39_06090 [Clostridia bacterium]|nr:hypothetical protein [Clostridia bacterium]
MDFRMKITLTLPEEMIKTMGITEDTLFITSYENGQIHVEPYDEDDLAEDFPDEEEFEEDYDDDAMEVDFSAALASAFERGTRQGYEDGYVNGFGDAHKGLPYNYYYRGRILKLHDHPADMPCSPHCRCKNNH